MRAILPIAWAAARACTRGLLASLALVGSLQQCADAAPLAPPLARPALALREPGRAVLLGLSHAGPQRIVAVGERGVVLISDDEGAHWRQATAVPVSVTLTAVQFATPQRGWAVGHQGVVLGTTDGGEHWQRLLDGMQAAQLLLQAARRSGDARALAEAQRLVAEGADKPLLALSFANEREGLVAGAFNLLLATEDGGQTWQAASARLDNPKSAHLYAMRRTGSEVLIAGEQGLLLHSVDGGARFQRVATPYAGSWFKLGREASGAWVLAGLRGQVWRSADAGAHWTSLASPGAISVTALAQDEHQGLWLANQAGQLLTPAGDGSPRLEVVRSTAAEQAAAMLRLADGGWLLAGWRGLSRVAPAAPSAPAAPALPANRPASETFPR